MRVYLNDVICSDNFTDKLSLQELGLPDTLEKIDGAMRWGYNDKTYFFSGIQWP